jgi:hypothetical protein
MDHNLDSDAAAEIERLQNENRHLRNALSVQISVNELKIIDKHCDWVAFAHAWDAVMKHRLHESTIGQRAARSLSEVRPAQLPATDEL